MRLKTMLLCLILACSLGCAKKAQAPVPGSINSFDALSYQALMDSQAAINAVKADISSGKFTPTPTQKAVLNQAIQDYDLGQTAWHLYHSGASNDTAGLTAAINQLVADIAAIAQKIQQK